MNTDTTVDFIARGESADQWQMVLVEEGPWEAPYSKDLRRLQDRLFGCVDAALDGLLAERFPESFGKEIVVRLDCYHVPKTEVTEFFKRFSEGVFAIDEYKKAIHHNKFVKTISFVVNFESIH